MARIPFGAFSECYELQSVSIPSGVTEIGEQAFAWCGELNHIEIPASVISVASDAFEGCREELFGFELAPGDGTVLNPSVKVALVSNVVEIGEIRYTTDGTMPTMASPLFSRFTVNRKMTITATRFIEGRAYCTKTFRYGMTGKVPDPWISVEGWDSFRRCSPTVSMGCSKEVAEIHYTLDGTAPTSKSPIYGQPFKLEPLEVGEDVVIRAIAIYGDWLDSGVVEWGLYRSLGIGDGIGSPDMAFEMNANLVWTVDVDGNWWPNWYSPDISHDGAGAVCLSGEMGNLTTNWVETTVMGGGAVSFWWRSSCEKDDMGTYAWDHGVFFVDGKEVAKIDGETDWSRVSLRIDGRTPHVLRWAYVKDEVESAGNDCIWIDELDWKPDEPDLILLTPVTPDPVTPCYNAVSAGDIIAPYVVPKAVTLKGAVYDGCDVVGIVELKLGKVNAKKKTGKVSGTVTSLDGKKHKIGAKNLTGIDGESPQTVSLEVKDYGTMTVTIGGTQFAGSMGRYHVQSANVGNDWGKGTATVKVTIGDLSKFTGTVIEELLPMDGVKGSGGGKWSFEKATSVKWAKVKEGTALRYPQYADSGKGLVVGDGSNLSGMKLTYTAKKGTFKGSFKVYALEGTGTKTKLKKYTIKVTGVVVDGVGYGTATCKNPAVTWSVTVE